MTTSKLQIVIFAAITNSINKAYREELLYREKEYLFVSLWIDLFVSLTNI